MTLLILNQLQTVRWQGVRLGWYPRPLGEWSPLFRRYTQLSPARWMAVESVKAVAQLSSAGGEESPWGELPTAPPGGR